MSKGSGSNPIGAPHFVVVNRRRDRIMLQDAVGGVFCVLLVRDLNHYCLVTSRYVLHYSLYALSLSVVCARGACFLTVPLLSIDRL